MEKGSRNWVGVSPGVQIGPHLTCGESGRRVRPSGVNPRPSGSLRLGAEPGTGDAGAPGAAQARTRQAAQAAASSSSAALRAQGSGWQERPEGASGR